MWTAIRNNLATALLALCLTPPAGAAVLEPFTATYKASRGILGLGEATFELARDNGCWQWSGVAEPAGLAALLIGRISDDSHFCVTEDGALRAQRFAHEEEGDTEDSYRLDFDPEAGTVQYNGGDAFEVPADAVDPFLLQLAARLWLEHADAPSALEPREFTIVDEDEIKRYRLAVSEGAAIETGAGTYETIRVARVDDSSKQLVIWAAPELDFLPVKVEHRKDGKTQIRFVLRNLDKPEQQGTL